MDRKSLLEQKRAKLEELKKQRALREKEFQDETSQSLKSSNVYVNNIVEEALGSQEGEDNTEKNKDEGKEIAIDNSSSSNYEKTTANVISETILHTSEENDKVCDPSLKVKIPLLTKAVDAENEKQNTTDSSSNRLDDQANDPKSKIYQAMKLSIEHELQKKYEQELKVRLSKITEEQENQIRKDNVNILKALQVPKDPLARNQERESRYAKPIAANCSVEELGNDIFTIDIPHFISKAFVLSANLKPTRAIFFPKSVLIVWDVDTRKAAFTFLSYATLTVAKFSTAKSNTLYAGGEDGKLYLWKFDSYSRYPTTSSEHNNDDGQISAVVAIYETVNSVYSVLANGNLFVYSLDLISQLSEESLGIPSSKDIFVTACYADATTVIAGLATGHIYMKRLGKDTKSTLIYSPEKSSRPHLSLPVMSINYWNGVILAGLFNHKILILEPRASKKIIHVPYPVSDVQFRSEMRGETSFRQVSRLTSKKEFATLSCLNQIDFWNIAKHELDPIAQMKFKADETLNRMAWSQNGKTIVCGGLTGKIYLIEIADGSGETKDFHEHAIVTNA
ncbi:hypothetical protein BRETT_002125 [Brettanomyces bruxellensis]|uniref:Uncharacterized protein n=1 Tax=Dekkera bruxellensis TaxID=5007 RepID=A0A871RHR9_DEKBR|nr:uncharacterized protein BRETT_002125 [Brettanomyces bruxellensis]QOU21961.1 hypothetical protein BRETT_002125 [Brettanomyces bruxellensis]